jgi:hypothetical protein
MDCLESKSELVREVLDRYEDGVGTEWGRSRDGLRLRGAGVSRMATASAVHSELGSSELGSHVAPCDVSPFRQLAFPPVCFAQDLVFRRNAMTLAHV